jgi:calreticulin
MAFALFISTSLAAVYLEERFERGWENRWKKPTHLRKGVQFGRVRISAGNFWGDEKIQRGMETIDSKRNYLFYSNLTHRFDSRHRDLIVQYTVRMSYFADCGGQYLKLLSSDTDPTKFSNETEYLLMFGPDICGATFRRTHVIIGHQGRTYPTLRPPNCFKDHLTHAYTLILRRNNTMEVLIDNEIMDEAQFSDRFMIPPTRSIPDPQSRKPADWDDDEWIVDPNDIKPKNWVEAEFISDPNAFKPPSWDDSVTWAPPMVKNPEYIGEWAPKVIANPKYKGIWHPKLIAADVEHDPTFGRFPQIGYLGLEFFHNTPNTIFDNFLITDDEGYAAKMLDEVFLSIREQEVKNFDAHQQRRRKEKEIEEIRRDHDRDHHHDHDRFTDPDDHTEEDYFNERKRLAKQPKPPLVIRQWDSL